MIYLAQIEIKLCEYTRDKLIPYDKVNSEIYEKFLALIEIVIEHDSNLGSKCGLNTELISRISSATKNFVENKHVENRVRLYEIIMQDLSHIIFSNKDFLCEFFSQFFNMQLIAFKR